MKTQFSSAVKGCARCGRTHRVMFHRFKRPTRDYTYWGMCPTTKEPILMKVVDQITEKGKA